MRTRTLIIVALVTVVAFSGAMLLVTLQTLGELDAAEVRAGQLDHAKHLAHNTEADLREQYIHQAHCIIEGDLSHLHRYEQAAEQARQTIASLSPLLTSDAEHKVVTQLRQLAERIDRVFRQQLIPALTTNRAAVVGTHRQLEQLVTRVTAINATLSASLNARSAQAQGEANRLRHRTRAMVILCFGAALVVALLIGGVLSRRIAGRIALLRRGAQRIAAGDLATRVALAGRDEFAELAQAFNGMASDLSRHQRQALRAQRLASIGQVAAGVAHEINNPLAVILGYTTMLKEKGAAPDALKKLAVIEAETRQCQRIVDDLLSLARPSELEPQRIDLVALTRSEIERHLESGRLRQAVPAFTADAKSAIIAADEGRVRQLISNLLVNAADAAPQGTIAVSVGLDSGRALLTVSDDGPGMTEDQLRRATEPFFTTKPTGVGLGLSISHAIVEAHGGELSLQRRVDGVGTTVCVALPCEDDR
ncbi:MAG: HAMP domain-containing protein [Deltaproteobacteria bacterium]|nr:HAMP domain-containing protein [Deltaproteobacteria bacterium]